MHNMRMLIERQARGVVAADTPPAGWPGDLARAEPLSEADAKEAADLSGLLEEYLIRCGLCPRTVPATTHALHIGML